MALDCTLEIEREEGAVRFAVTVENAGSEPVELTFSDGQTVEVVVGEESEPVWQYSAGRMFTQALRTEPLSPGEQLVESVTWSDSEPGEYTVRAWCCANGVDCEARKTLSV